MEADIRYLIEQGKEFFKSQAYKKAEAIFLKIISAKKEYADVYNMLGIINHQGGQLSQAIDYFKKALKINPHYKEALLNLSVLYNDIGEYKQAKLLLTRSKKEDLKDAKEKIDPYIKGKLANKHAEVGNTYRGFGLYAQAVNEFKKACELAPHFYDLHNKLGICLREDGKKKEALEEFRLIIKKQPKYLDAQIQLGVTLYACGEKTKARQIWQKIAKENPYHAMARMYLKLSEAKKKK